MFEAAAPDEPPEPIPFLVTSSGLNNSPGPAEYGNQGDILSNVPKLHLHSKNEPKVDVNQAPYRSIGSSIGSGRKYTIKGKYEETVISTPGCDYVPESFGKDGKSVYVHTRPTEKSIDPTPGPADYSTNVKLGQNSPKYTFHGPRGERLFKNTSDSPGPSDYDQRKPSNSLRISIGNKYTKRSEEVTPGPGSYDPSGLMSPQKNKGVIGIRTAQSTSTISPGPADYAQQGEILKNVPRLFLHSRSVEKKNVNTAGYQNTRGLFSNAEKGASASANRKYSLRSRYNLPERDATPGVDYMPPAFGSSSIKCSISPRFEKVEEGSSPGPGKYNTESVFGKNARKSVFHSGRSYSRSPDTGSPGPADYDTSSLSTKSRSPRYTIKSGRYDPQKDKTGEYVNLGSTLKGPKHSLGQRPSLGVAYS